MRLKHLDVREVSEGVVWFLDEETFSVQGPEAAASQQKSASSRTLLVFTYAPESIRSITVKDSSLL